MGLVSWFRKILRKQAIVEELGDEEITKTGEFDDKSKGPVQRLSQVRRCVSHVECKSRGQDEYEYEDYGSQKDVGYSD